MQKERTITEIIFPTDFDDESRQVFPAVVNFARMCGAKIRILHCIFRPVTLLPGDRLASAQNTYVKAQKRAALKQIDEFMAAAHSAGVKSRGEVIASEQPVSDVVARVAKKRAVSLIAMAARSGALSTAVAGSITRNVIRSAQVPVWVLRAGAVTAKAREPRAAA
jgi:nucleotide-binding universal stress UspA family protein